MEYGAVWTCPCFLLRHTLPMQPRHSIPPTFISKKNTIKCLVKCIAVCIARKARSAVPSGGMLVYIISPYGAVYLLHWVQTARSSCSGEENIMWSFEDTRFQYYNALYMCLVGQSHVMPPLLKKYAIHERWFVAVQVGMSPYQWRGIEAVCR